MSRRVLVLVAAVSLGLAVVVATAEAPPSRAAGSNTAGVTASALPGGGLPTFVGPAATGCNTPGCSLLSGPFRTPSTANLSSSAAANVSNAVNAAALNASAGATDRPAAMPFLSPTRSGPDPAPPSVSCQPQGAGCDAISTSNGGASTALGLDAVDSGTMQTALGNPNADIEPPDQGLCAGNNYVVETNNVGEILVYDTALHRQSGVIPLDTLMGLTARDWSSGGDPSCEYDYANGGHWFFTEFVSETSEASGGPFSGCFVGVPNGCQEGIAVSTGSSPFGPYNVYFLNPDYNPNEPGSPSLLNDFAKIGLTRDALLLFYDEFPLTSPGLGFYFNGAQEFAIDKKALELGLPVTKRNGTPNPVFNVAIENMGNLPTPDGLCSVDGACWYQVIPAQPASPADFDNANGGTGFMLASLDFFGQGDTRIAAFDWTDLSALDSGRCARCGGIRFGGTLLSGVEPYYGEGFLAAQKAGSIPLGDECAAAGLLLPPSTLTSCPEGGIATNGDGMTQVSQAGGQLWGAVSTAVSQSFGDSSPEVHQGAAYWVLNTSSFDTTGLLSLTDQGYVSAAHEDLEFPAIGAVGYGQGQNSGPTGSAIMSFTLSGDGGPTGADSGGFYPSSAFGRLTTSSSGLSNSTIDIAALGQSPQDGFTEYQFYGSTVPGLQLRPRWGDYGWAIFDPPAGKVYFASEYIPFATCTGSAFTLTVGTCGGTRDGYANWGTSVNSVTP